MLYSVAMATGVMLSVCLAPAFSTADSRNTRHIGGGGEHNHAHHHGGGGGDHAQGGNPHQLEADDPDFSGVVDFSNAIPGPGGSWCITKTKYVDHMVKDQIKECWHQNVTQCHDTYVTEFLPSQEQKCEESFWKSCKIDFREMPFNYTMKQCHTPLTKMCDPSPSYGKPKIVCKTWFESECNTTFTETTPNVEDKPNTWCKKVPRKICAPDNCRMVAGPEECNDKTLVSTVQKPTEICDLQPQQHCRLITKLTPHLISKEVCKNIPKEVCHLALTGPKMVRKPITLKWCTRKNEEGQHRQQIPSYNPNKPSYLPPPPPPQHQPPQQVSFPDQTFAPPTYTSPPQSFQVRNDDQQDITYSAAASNSDSIKVAPKFTPPAPGKKYYKPVEIVKHKKRSSVGNGNVHKKKDIFEVADAIQPVFQEQFKPSASVRSKQASIQIPESFRQAVKDAGLLDEMEREGFELVEARVEQDEADHQKVEDAVDEEVDEELLDELLNARPLPPRLSPVGFTDDLGDDVLARVGGHGNDGGLGGFAGLRRRR